MFDLLIVVGYFVFIFAIGMRSRVSQDVSVDEYFLSSRSLRWPTIAISTIATNISAGHFIGMAGSAYLFGLAQANFEINAIFGILMAVFFFVPLYLRLKVTTISQFFESRFGPGVALTYSLLMMFMYGFMYLGSALYWGAYAINLIFADYVVFLGSDPMVRVAIIAVVLGVFSAAYTYLGGMTAVVRTDIAQFVLLIGGGMIVVWLAIDELGGWAQLYETGLPKGVAPGEISPHHMHLHLPADHEKLPWIAIIGMNLLNLNYWGANQVILQRALAAKSLRHAQVGLLVGGVFKYLIVLIAIVPAIALVGLTMDAPLTDPDAVYPYMVNELLPPGLRGMILCGLLASLMSTVDSTFNSVSTLWSIDVYKRHLRPDASDAQVVSTGQKAILVTLMTGVLFAYIQIYVKFMNDGEELALTHWFNEMTYYVKNGFVVLIVAAVFLVKPSSRLVMGAFGLSIVLYFLGAVALPDMNYMVRSSFVIVIALVCVAVPTMIMNGWRIPMSQLIERPEKAVTRFGLAMLASLILSHIVFH